jgi:hypothetical protein
MAGERQKSVIFWAVVRVAFGIAQMTGAVTSAVLLFMLGAVRETIVAVSITAILMLSSVSLFKWLKVQERAQR